MRDLTDAATRNQVLSAERQLRELMAKSLTGNDRQIVASEIKRLTGMQVSKRQLDDWAAPSREGLRLPASLIKTFCEITGDDALALAVIPSHLHEYIAVGKWVMESEWVLDMVSVKLRKQGQRLLRTSKILRRAAERRR